MNHVTITLLVSITSIILNGCTTVTTEVISEPSGARIEVDNDYMGTTPLTVKLRQDGFGKLSNTIVVRALPIFDGQYTQTKVLHWEDPVPKTLFFQMNLVPANTD